jgi:hypothetical protein
MVGEKTFQQVTEEFAEIVIPKVWLREEKKISRVAKCLSISPKRCAAFFVMQAISACQIHCLAVSPHAKFGGRLWR